MENGNTEAYSLGSINVDAAKELFAFLAQVYPFVDETAKNDFAAKVNALDTAGNPNETTPDHPIIPPVAEAETTATEETPEVVASEPSELEQARARVAELEAQKANPDVQPPPEGAGALGDATASEETPA